MQDRLPRSAPDLFEDSGNRFHIYPHCAYAYMGEEVCSVLEPCYVCTNAKTFLLHDVVYRTAKGRKYHSRNCNNIRAKLLIGNPNEARTVRALTSCKCIIDYYMSLTSEDGNDYAQ